MSLPTNWSKKRRKPLDKTRSPTEVIQRGRWRIEHYPERQQQYTVWHLEQAAYAEQDKVHLFTRTLAEAESYIDKEERRKNA